jgi:hypothetical protein
MDFGILQVMYRLQAQFRVPIYAKIKVSGVMLGLQT